MKKESFIIIISLLLLSFFSTIITKDFLTTNSAEKGLFFNSIIFLNKIEFSTSNVLWSMPLSQLIYSVFSMLEIKYLDFYIFMIYFFCYYLLSVVVKYHTSSIRQIFLFFILVGYHIFFFQNFDIEQLFYSTYLILIAFSFQLKEKDNTIKNNIFLSLLIGTSFLIRTTLIIVPLILFIYEVTINRNIKKATLLLFLPYIIAFTPYIALSYTLTENIQIMETNRLGLNLLTSFFSITYTAEGNIEILKEILNQISKNFNIAFFLKALFTRFLFFIEIYHIFLFISIFIIIKYKNRLSLSLGYLSIIFLMIHLTTSIEKRYLFPLGLVFAIIISTASTKEQKYLTINWNKLFFLSLIPLIVLFLIIIRYTTFKKTENTNKNVINLTLAIESLYKLEREKSINYLKKYISKRKYLYTNHIKEVLSIIENNDKDYIIQRQKNPSLLFNVSFIKFLKLIYINQKEEALKFLERNWDEISQSYLRNPTNEVEREININLSNYIKENFMTFPSFILVTENLKDFSRICEEANSIIGKINKKHKFKCLYAPNIITIPYDKYIANNCLNKNYNRKIQKIVFKIIEMENRKEFEKAIELIDKNLDKKIYKFYVEKGNIYYAQAKYDDALENYSKAIELCECAADAIYGKAHTLEKLKKYNEKKLLEENIKKKCKFILIE